ncbi:2-succinyl-5-enolpyruvyl-6-hydroxy-3-cyclohexene-1-carboxylic-acid synthase [uncultured Gulosibacter sp.]|uniref:2-succinyl-5-enolpyruvyl-6-hydroxy-3- cyclohexene-1-carboxylic-acid synthase n=1 Tax=uncultured Gulosibacter sp. TaxID=1339167 RepID=UPI00288AAC5F|nr:2-succinyl-5-enolpyruvyl-6-hydroxy-3-cyclohexene-1-carboxylic-acid synthase [uncultured Gulosibacter sp.]
MTVPAVAAAVAVLTAATERVHDVVVCPGSRSQALALVAAKLEQLGTIRLHVRLDERAAAFFALGLARESQRPVPVIVTSGTAVANLHPAMLEAHHAGVPLVAITADRPAELVGTGANQTTTQPGIFGPLLPTRSLSAPSEADAANNFAAWRTLGEQISHTRIPLHCNLAMREPLSGAVPELSTPNRFRRAAEPAEHDLPEHGDRRIHFGTGPRGLSDKLAAAITRELAHGSENRPPVTVSQTAADPERILEIDPADYPRAIVIAGDRAGAEPERTARKGGWPLIAEVSSGARYGRNLVVAYRDLLGANSPIPGLRDSIDLVIVYGHPTLSRETTALMQRPNVRVLVVEDSAAPPLRPGGEEHFDRVKVTAFAATQLLSRGEAMELRAEADQWLQGWLHASRELERARDTDPEAPDIAASRSSDSRERARFGRAELAVSREPVHRRLLADAVWRVTWPHDRLVVAASRLIRDLDGQVAGKRIRVHANRGLAGIDGTIATALGVATASQFGDDERAATGTTRLLIGDIAFAYDAASLLVGQGGEPAPRMQIIVGVDGGGSLFDSLEVRDTAEAAAYERVQFTPLSFDIEAVARAYGWEYELANTRGKLEAALTDQRSMRKIIAVPLPR